MRKLVTLILILQIVVLLVIALDQDGKNYPNANLGTTIYSNYNGTINVEGCEFKNIDVAVNMNHKVEGEQTVNIKDTNLMIVVIAHTLMKKAKKL